MKATCMPPEEVRAILLEVFGPGCQEKAHQALGITRVTINRWCNGGAPVGHMESKLLLVILAMHRMGMDWRKYVAKDPLMLAQGLNSVDELI